MGHNELATAIVCRRLHKGMLGVLYLLRLSPSTGTYALRKPPLQFKRLESPKRLPYFPYQIAFA